MSRRWRPGLWSTCPREVLAPAMRGVICTGKLVGDMYRSRREAARGGGKAAPLLLPKARAIELGPERALALRPRLPGPLLRRHRRNARRARRVRAGRNRQHRGPLAPSAAIASIIMSRVRYPAGFGLEREARVSRPQFLERVRVRDLSAVMMMMMGKNE